MLAVLAAAGSAADRQGFERAPSGACPSELSSDDAADDAVRFPGRPGRDRALLPVGYRDLAPIDAVVCRYDPQGRLAVGLALDASRTAGLVGLLAVPVGEWPDDPLVAKTIHPLTDAELAAAAAPVCARPAPADLVRFRYGQGEDAAVLVRGAPCLDAANGVIRLRVKPEVSAAFEAMPGG
jgi:hypothetical protein